MQSALFIHVLIRLLVGGASIATVNDAVVVSLLVVQKQYHGRYFVQHVPWYGKTKKGRFAMSVNNRMFTCQN